MKILFIISNIGNGSGGHFHSLNHISRELSKIFTCKILILGSNNSPVITGNPSYNHTINVNGLNYYKFLKEFKEYVKAESPDILHFFDIFSFNIVRCILNTAKQKICVTKCGGPNPRIFSFVPNIVLFSLENFKWFRNKKKFNKSNIQVIPNRVKNITLDPQYQPIKKNGIDFNFIRICRIGITYMKSIEDSINLIDYLQENGFFHVNLYIVGYIENVDIYNKLVQSTKSKKYIHFITSLEIIKEASRMLYLADVVLGTGRGLMEAASLKIPILTFNSSDRYPILVDSYSFAELFETNFSERGTLKNFDEHENKTKIIRMIEDEKYYQELAHYSGSIFNDHFSIKNVNKLYSIFYSNLILKKKNTFVDILYSFRHIALFLKKNY